MGYDRNRKNISNNEVRKMLLLEVGVHELT